jgi:hypothetical protein
VLETRFTTLFLITNTTEWNIFWKLRGAHLVNKFPEFYTNQRFIIVFTRAATSVYPEAFVDILICQSSKVDFGIILRCTACRVYRKWWYFHVIWQKFCMRFYIIPLPHPYLPSFDYFNNKLFGEVYTGRNSLLSKFLLTFSCFLYVKSKIINLLSIHFLNIL